MATVSTEARYTPEDLLFMEDGHRYELIDGRLVERHMGALASLIGSTLMTLVGIHVRAQRLGLVFNPECGYQIFGKEGNNVRFADGSFIRRGRLPDDRPPNGHMRMAPDLVVEVVSPNDLAYEVEQKVEDYLQVGVRLIWVVFPNTCRVMVYRPDGKVARLIATDELSGEDVIPGFTCRLDEVFAGI